MNSDRNDANTLTSARAAAPPRGLRTWLLASVAALSSMAVGNAALAATAAAAPAAAPDQSGTNVEEVVVTARKRSERLLDVPAAISVLSAKDLSRYGVKDMKSLTSNVPNLTIVHLQAGSGGFVSIRGMGGAASSGDIGITPEAVLNIDGITVTQGRYSTLGLLDPAHVDVLKGPQALYYGKNSPAGVVSIDSVDPGKTFSGYIHTSYEFTTAAPTIEGAVTIPVNDTLSIRLAGNLSDERGYVRNYAVPEADPLQPQFIDPGAAHKYSDGSNQQIGRISVKWTPTEQFSALLKYTFGRFKANSDLGDITMTCQYGVQQLYSGFLDFRTFMFHPFVDPVNHTCSTGPHLMEEASLNPTLASHFLLSNGGVPYSLNETQLFSGVVSYDFGNLVLTSTTGSAFLRNDSFTANTGTSFPFYMGGADSQSAQLSEEIRLTSKFQGPVNFMLGGYWEDAHNHYNFNDYFFGVNPDPRNGSISSALGTDYGTDRTWSGFGSVDWKILDTLTLSAGARYTNERVSTSLMNAFVNESIPFPFFYTEGKLVNPLVKGVNVSPEVTLSWHPEKTINIYGAFKTGYKSGGVSEASILSFASLETPPTFKPEKSTGGEIGVKGEFLDNRLTLNTDVYYYKFTNLQVSALLTLPLAPPTFITRNAAAALTEGWEADSTYLVMPGLTVRGDLAYNDAHYTDYKTAPCVSDQSSGPAPGCVGGVQDLSGQPLQRAPLWSGSVGFTYTHDLPQAWLFTLDGDVVFSGSYYTGAAIYPQLLQGNYALLNAGIKFSNTNGFSVSVAGRNLTDEFVVLTRANDPGTNFGIYQTLPLPPREVTITLGYDF